VNGLRLLLCSTLIAGALLGQFDKQPSPADQEIMRNFVGTWKLAALNGERPTTGSANAVSDQATGTIIYDDTGHVSVQILYQLNRPKFAKGPSSGTTEEKAAAFDSYTAYWGTYTVDAKAGTVTHHIQGALNPNNVGKDNLRYYEFHGNRLTLNNPDDGKGGFRDRKDTSRQLVWERIGTR
jgi:hypothetical protein